MNKSKTEVLEWMARWILKNYEIFELVNPKREYPIHFKTKGLYASWAATSVLQTGELTDLSFKTITEFLRIQNFLLELNPINRLHFDKLHELGFVERIDRYKVKILFRDIRNHPIILQLIDFYHEAPSDEEMTKIRAEQKRLDAIKEAKLRAKLDRERQIFMDNLRRETERELQKMILHDKDLRKAIERDWIIDEHPVGKVRQLEQPTYETFHPSWFIMIPSQTKDPQ